MGCMPVYRLSKLLFIYHSLFLRSSHFSFQLLWCVEISEPCTHNPSSSLFCCCCCCCFVQFFSSFHSSRLHEHDPLSLQVHWTHREQIRWATTIPCARQLASTYTSTKLSIVRETNGREKRQRKKYIYVRIKTTITTAHNIAYYFFLESRILNISHFCFLYFLLASFLVFGPISNRWRKKIFKEFRLRFGLMRECA